MCLAGDLAEVRWALCTHNLFAIASWICHKISVVDWGEPIPLVFPIYRAAIVGEEGVAGRRAFRRWDRPGGGRHCAVLWMGCSLGVLLYSIAVLTHVARMGSIGVRCMFGTKVEEVIPADYIWHDSRPRIGDTLLSIGASEIHERSYSDYIRACGT